MHFPQTQAFSPHPSVPANKSPKVVWQRKVYYSIRNETQFTVHSNLIERRNKLTFTSTSSYSDRLQSYIIVSSFKAHSRTERPTTIKKAIRLCYKFVRHYYCSAIQPTTVALDNSFLQSMTWRVA